jgi:hypothetical protein
MEHYFVSVPVSDCTPELNAFTETEPLINVLLPQYRYIYIYISIVCIMKF